VRACSTAKNSESDINPRARTPLSHTVREPQIAVAAHISFHPSTLQRAAAMDASRKRKANNATPSNTDGSATKKIKLVVRVPSLYTIFCSLDCMCRSRADDWRIRVFVCV